MILERSVVSALATLSPTSKRRVKATLADLAKSPKPAGPHALVKRLDAPGSGAAVFRLKIGDYRAVYVIRGPEIRVLRVFDRDQGYDWLKRLRLD